MITTANFEKVLEALGFIEKPSKITTARAILAAPERKCTILEKYL